ncbi:hypothetical protein IGI04_026813, partial [Brassica rapa subsp. trilocularis]
TPLIGPVCEKNQDLVVADLLCRGSREWNVTRIESLLPQYLPNIMSIKPSVLGAPDSFGWLASKLGNYTAKSGLYGLDETDQPPTAGSDRKSIPVAMLGNLDGAKLPYLREQSLSTCGHYLEINQKRKGMDGSPTKLAPTSTWTEPNEYYTSRNDMRRQTGRVVVGFSQIIVMNGYYRGRQHSITQCPH